MQRRNVNKLQGNSLRHSIPLVLLCCVIVFCGSGATCIPKRASSEFEPPILFQTPPTLTELVEVVNRTSGVYQYQLPAVNVRLAGMPTLSATLDWQRERNFRMRGGLSRMTGVDFDLGSNDEIFWMSSRHDMAPTLYYAYHAQFESQLNRQILPVSPLWLVEALGIISIRPEHVTEPPQVGPDGLIRLSSIVPSPAGNYFRTLHIDAKQGTVKQIMLRDPNGRLLANAVLSRHEYRSAINASLPRTTQVQLMPVGGEPLTLEVSFEFYRINEDVQLDTSKFANPPTEGFQVVDLANLNLGSPSVTMPAYQAEQPQAYDPDLRGVEMNR